MRAEFRWPVENRTTDPAAPRLRRPRYRRENIALRMAMLLQGASDLDPARPISYMRRLAEPAKVAG